MSDRCFAMLAGLNDPGCGWVGMVEGEAQGRERWPLRMGELGAQAE
jgi:hypothetical protein